MRGLKQAPLRLAPKRKAAARNNVREPIRPMLATLADAPFDREGWLFEIKWDGYRAIAELEGDEVRLYSRNGLSFEHKFQPVVKALATLGHEAIFDGEVVVMDERGRASFQLLQNYQKTGQGHLVYYVFDLLELDGRDLRREPLLKRKQMLAKLLKKRNPQIVFSEHIEEAGTTFFDAAVRQNLEGIMAKRADSPYQDGRRSGDWLKIKVRQRQEAVIAGFTQPRGSRKNLGSLVLGVYRGKELIYVGHTGGGFSDQSLGDVRKTLDPLVSATCPFAKKPVTNGPATWVEPNLVCEVVFQEWTEDGVMRQPIFLGLREDKPAKAVRREA